MIRDCTNRKKRISPSLPTSNGGRCFAWVQDKSPWRSGLDGRLYLDDLGFGVPLGVLAGITARVADDACLPDLVIERVVRVPVDPKPWGKPLDEHVQIVAEESVERGIRKPRVLAAERRRRVSDHDNALCSMRIRSFEPAH